MGKKWYTFNIFRKKSLPLYIYYNLDGEDKKTTRYINAGVKFSYLLDNEENILQILIPINDELQLHIYKEEERYKLTQEPIIYRRQKESVSIVIKSSIYQDLYEETNSAEITREVIDAYKNSVNFKALQKGDKLVAVYEQKYRLGHRFGGIKVLATMVQNGKKENYIYRFNDRFYNKNGVEVRGFSLMTPLKYRRISSRFTYKRYHPILKKYRPHLGIDYSARSGTPVRAAANGVVILVRKSNRGYGNVLKIRHAGGYSTLYAHLKSFSRYIRVGSRVSKGSIIAYVGNTGLSTGPHLHFELMKNNRRINPASSIVIRSKYLAKKHKQDFLKHTNKLNEELNFYLNNKTIFAKNRKNMLKFHINYKIKKSEDNVLKDFLSFLKIDELFYKNV